MRKLNQFSDIKYPSPEKEELRQLSKDALIARLNRLKIAFEQMIKIGLDPQIDAENKILVSANIEAFKIRSILRHEHNWIDPEFKNNHKL